jgi:hypothetical protein
MTIRGLIRQLVRLLEIPKGQESSFLSGLGVAAVRSVFRRLLNHLE